VVAFVEDVAAGHILAGGCHGGVDHDEGVVGDDDAGMFCCAHRMFDEAFGVVIAGGIDAFTATVGEAAGVLEAEDTAEPAGVACAGEVAVFAGCCPARHDAGGDGGLWVFGEGGARGGFFEVEEAKVIFAPLAGGDMGVFDGGVGVEAVELLVDLALQVFGVGGNPDAALVFFRPDGGGGEITEGFADACAGFGEDDVGCVLVRRWVERGGDLGGVFGLWFALFCPFAEEFVEALAGFVAGDGEVGSGAFGGFLCPFGEVFPDIEIGFGVDGGGGVVGFAEGGEDKGRPAPAFAVEAHGAGDGGGWSFGGVRIVLQIGEKHAGDVEHAHRGVFEAFRFGEAEGFAESVDGWCCEASRVGEGEELEEVEGEEVCIIAQAAARVRGVADHDRLFVNEGDGLAVW